MKSGVFPFDLSWSERWIAGALLDKPVDPRENSVTHTFNLMLLGLITKFIPFSFHVIDKLHEEVNAIAWYPTIRQRAKVDYRPPFILIQCRRSFNFPCYSISCSIRVVETRKKPKTDRNISIMTIGFLLIRNLQFIWLRPY